MTDKLATATKMSPGLDAETMLSVIAGGDANKLTDAQRLAYYNARCEAAGLDPRTQPFEFIKLDNKLQLYARKAATDQLTAKHGISTEILSEVTENGLRTVRVRVTKKDGVFAQNVGVVPVEGLKGNFLANAYMKAVTKALRRAILAVCGLGMLDESEIESIPAGKVERLPVMASDAPAPSAPAVPPPDNTQRAAEQIVEQVQEQAALQADAMALMTPKARQRRDTLWRRLVGSGQGQIGMSNTKACTWMTMRLKSVTPIKSVDDVTDDQLAQLEAALSHEFGD